MVSKKVKAYSYLIQYSERLGIIAPRMIIEKPAYRRFIRDFHQRKRMPRIGNFNLGRAFIGYNVIWVYARRHRNMIQLRHTIAHELVHIKYPSLPHGEKFEDIIRKVISNRYVE